MNAHEPTILGTGEQQVRRTLACGNIPLRLVSCILHYRLLAFLYSPFLSGQVIPSHPMD